ncbi:Sec7 domain-containing protein, partial [Elsinoe ampelina]
MGPPRKLGFRDRASTNSTFGRPSEDITPPTPPTLSGSTRNSTSTGGRASLGGFLTLGRFRGADSNGSRHDSPGAGSKQNSMTISRDTIALPERIEGETAAKYLERLQSLASRNVIAAMLSKSTDSFFQNVLRSYTRRFAFFGEPIDMSLRKFLLEAELPKETQQVDRVMQAFADRYHECNPGIFLSPDEAYVIAFSLMMLHTDAFNRNNKYKMQKNDYIKNTRGQHVSEDVLACFYDNICYTPFIHFDEDDFDAGSDRLSSFKSKKAKLKGAMPDPTKKSSGPVDPYSLIIDNKLDVLRPSIKDSIVLEDPYSYLGTAKMLEPIKMQKKFHYGGILQIISARSRPAAFENQASRDNPDESKPGVVDLQVTKVGILWRKSAKRKKARSPWQEWGAILTGSQLYFFKNISWIKNLMQQFNAHQKHMVPPSPVVFKPPLEEFKPDSLIKTDDAVALIDASYNRHKNAFTLVRHGGEEEIFLADS